MNPGLVVLLIGLFAVLALVRLWRPIEGGFNDFELQRRIKLGDAAAGLAQQRFEAFPLLMGLRRITSAGLLFAVFGVALALAGTGWAVALVVIAVVVSGYAERHFRFADWTYAKFEPALLRFAATPVGRHLPAGRPEPRRAQVASTEELAHVITKAAFLDAGERDSILAALEFPHLTVRDIMRPRSALATIDKGEVIGPLVIDDLYKTGETTFLVVDGGIDHVEGVLPLDKLTGLELRESPNALKAMEDTISFIDETAPVAEALRRLRSREITLLVVKDAGERTVGAVSFNEIIARLFKA